MCGTASGRMEEGSDQAGAGGFGEGGVDQHDREDDHDDAGGPGDQVETPGVGVFAHQVAAIDQQQNENQYDGKPDAVGDLREDENFEQRGFGQQDDSAADDD